ncbi:MAG: hypothetical protein R3B55_02155 [Candidatus Paceibacterota bacterium]
MFYLKEKKKLLWIFVKRKRSDIKNEIKKKMNLRTIPFVDIEIDKGEKNRQKIHDLLFPEQVWGKIYFA